MRSITASATVFIAPFLAAVIAALPAGPAARAESAASGQFLQHFFTGCIRIGKPSERGPGYGRAYCLCSASLFRTEIEERALDEISDLARRGRAIDAHPGFRRVIERRSSCEAVGTHDDSRVADIGTARAYGGFSMALPEGYLLLGRNTSSRLSEFAFHRFHADLVTTTSMRINMLSGQKAVDGEAAARAAEFHLSRAADGLKSRRQRWRQGETEEVRLADLTFKRIEWTAQENQRALAGALYAAAAGDRVVVIRIEDDASMAGNTFPALRASLNTFRLR